MSHQNRERCPRCQTGRLRSWSELSEEEREVTRRLPDSALYGAEERRTAHRWCTTCWHETIEPDSRDA